MGEYNFKINEKGVWYLPPSSKDEIPDPIWICSPLRVTGITRDENNENHGRFLVFFDSDGEKHEWAMPMEFLAGDGLEIRKTLLSMGLHITTIKKYKEYLPTYIQSTLPEAKFRCVNKTGWFKDNFIFPNQIISGEGNSQDEQVVFQTKNHVFDCYGVKGTLEQWQQYVSNYCVGNSRLTFAVSIAFASPLLLIKDEENGGFHFRGPSSIGKTKTLNVAASVFGGEKMIHTWRTTSNGLESIAAFHNDCLLCLDEMGQIAPKEIGDVAYLLANGSGKSRSTKHGFARPKQAWRLNFISNGEVV